jgi:hypothetical protein
MTSRDPSARPTAADVAARLGDLGAAATGADVGAAPTSALGGTAAGSWTTVGDSEVDGLDRTEALEVGGGTTVMPAMMRPAPVAGPATAPGPMGQAPDARRSATGRSRPGLWLALGVIALVFLLGLASRGGDPFEAPVDTTPTTSSVAPVVSAPTTVPPPPTTEAPPPTDKPAKGRGGAKGKGKDGHD